MELYSIDQEKIRSCSEAEIKTVIESFNQATIDPGFYIQMIAGRVLKISFKDGDEVVFTSYGSKTNVIAKINSKSYHLVAPEIAKLLLQTD